MLSSSRTIYPLFRGNRIGPYMRFINFSHAVRQEQSLPRTLSTTRYKGLVAQHSPHHVRLITTIPGDTEFRIWRTFMYERIKGSKKETPQRGDSSKAHDTEVEQKGEKSSSEVKRKAGKSRALKQEAENAAFDKAFETGQLDKLYRLRWVWWTSSRPDKKRERIFHRMLQDAQGSAIPLMTYADSHDLDECMYHDENGRIQCVSEDGQVFVQEEWASRSVSGLDGLRRESDLKLLSGGIMKTTKRETR